MSTLIFDHSSLPDMSLSGKSVKQLKDASHLIISEMFGNTIQGEGVNAGHPATFLRLTGCTLKCTWCDTIDVWTSGKPYTPFEILEQWERVSSESLLEVLRQRQTLVLTGGSPLKQERGCLELLRAIEKKYGERPVVEIENEAVLMPTDEMIERVEIWNNSPKLENSKMPARARIKPEVLKKLNELPNSWFKFVVEKDSDITEILRDFGPYISEKKIVLMPKMDNNSPESLEVAGRVADLAVKNGLLFTPRLHIHIWNQKTGV